MSYGQNKGKAYNEEEDRFILCKTHELGYGQWDELKAAIRRHWRFRCAHVHVCAPVFAESA